MLLLLKHGQRFSSSKSTWPFVAKWPSDPAAMFRMRNTFCQSQPYLLTRPAIPQE